MSKLLSNRDPIAADGDESTIEGHHFKRCSFVRKFMVKLYIETSVAKKVIAKQSPFRIFRMQFKTNDFSIISPYINDTTCFVVPDTLDAFVFCVLNPMAGIRVCSFYFLKKCKVFCFIFQNLVSYMNATHSAYKTD